MARAKIIEYFVERQHMTSFFQIQGGASAPLAHPCGRPRGLRLDNKKYNRTRRAHGQAIETIETIVLFIFLPNS